MRALTLTQPWATLVVGGLKYVETRSWATSYRGPLAIHAARGFPREAREFAGELWLRGLLPEPRALPTGAIVAVVRLVDIQRTERVREYLAARELEFGDYSPNRFAWLFEFERVIDPPVACNGSLGIWEVPDELLAARARP